MPTWTHEIPDDPRGPALPIRRTPAHRPLIAVVTSPDLIGTYTHYWKNRTMPCTKPDCEPCAQGQPYRWHAYMSCWESTSALHFLFEVTAQAAQHFVTYRQAHGTLRGCKFRATRWRSNPNGRVLIECKPANIVEQPIPQPPDLIAVLSILWNLPRSGMNADRRANDQPMPNVDVSTAAAIAAPDVIRFGTQSQPTNQNNNPHQKAEP